jgi:hypothetical protein
VLKLTNQEFVLKLTNQEFVLKLTNQEFVLKLTNQEFVLNKSRVCALEARQWTCPRVISVVYGPKYQTNFQGDPLQEEW